MRASCEKTIGEKEKTFLDAVALTDISVNFEIFPSRGGKYILRMGRWPRTLGSYVEENGRIPPFLANKIKEKIVRLHSLGILHGDLHGENIVTDGEEVRLIDFGECVWIKDITIETIRFFKRFWDTEGFKIETLSDLLEFEREHMWRI